MIYSLRIIPGSYNVGGSQMNNFHSSFYIFKKAQGKDGLTVFLLTHSLVFTLSDSLGAGSLKQSSAW